MNSIKRILISRLRFIGDVVLTTPVIHAVRQKFPDAYLAYLGEKEAVSLLENNPNLNEIIPFDFSKIAIVEQSRIIRKLRAGKFDVFVDLFSNPRTALLAWFSGAPVRIGKAARIRSILYTHHIQDDQKPKTAIDFHLQYLLPLNISPSFRKTEIYLTEEEKNGNVSFLKNNGIDPLKPIVGMHVGATWPAKMWLIERFAKLANLIAQGLNTQVVITQGPEDSSRIASLSGKIISAVKVLDVMPLRKLAALLSFLKVYVSNDCAPMHIAVAVKTNTIGIFGPGEESIWFPYLLNNNNISAGHLAIRKEVPCHPCHLDFCNLKGDDYMKCMKLLSVEEVFEAIKKRL